MAWFFRIICWSAALLYSLPLSADEATWHPKPSDAPEEAFETRIVKQGLEHQRTGDAHSYMISSMHRMRVVPDGSGSYSIKRAGDDIQRAQDFDVDGDGRTDDDLVIFHAFDLSRDNPLTPIGPFYDTTVGTQRFYGGLTLYYSNIEATGNYGFTEDGMNDAEEGSGNQPRRNWAWFNERAYVFSPFRMYGVWLWQKFDFLNGGADHRVSFDENSQLRHLVMRYNMGIEGFRWVVRNGDRFYISQQVYKYADDVPGRTGGKIHVGYPTRMRWAEYKPHAPYHVQFDAGVATFRDVQFDNVTAVGYYLFKDKLIAGYVGHKWYAFEADAVVHRPNRPSEYVDMVPVDEDAVPAFYIATCEVPFEFWRKVRRLAVYNGWAGPRGYGFRRQGDMGSMDMPGPDGTYLEHHQHEPLTDTSFADALAWCNALSIQAGRTPCYYTDADFTEEFREVVKGDNYLMESHPPTVYIKWDADGYRLPTPSEWKAALAGQEPAVQNAWIGSNAGRSTHRVGTKAANDLGIHDLFGNVWEMVWTHGDSVDLAAYDSFVALGGDFRYPADPTASSANSYGDRPFEGSSCVGIRLVRRGPGLPAPPTEAGAEVPSWTIARGKHTASHPERQLVTPLPADYLDLIAIPGKDYRVAKHEVTFAKWRPVYDWSVARGYSFDSDGEMGSMSYWGFGPDWQAGRHSPEEPVTGITHYDAMVWCNAFSEISGRQPAYEDGKDGGAALKASYIYRPPQLLLGETTGVVAGWGACFTWLKTNEHANGFRLPTDEEFYGLCGMDPKAPHLPEGVLEHAWLADNSGLRSHPVGLKGPGVHGLCDLMGNVAELGSLTDKGAHLGSRLLGYASRNGGHFSDTVVGFGNREFMQSRGLGYPDVGFRVLCKR